MGSNEEGSVCLTAVGGGGESSAAVRVGGQKVAKIVPRWSADGDGRKFRTLDASTDSSDTLIKISPMQGGEARLAMSQWPQ